MEQRRVRLGDIVDDYCPRERRITNHAVVAMIEEDIRLTRCTTCDTEHPYKNARVPRRRKKETPAFDQVLAGRREAAPQAAAHPEIDPTDEASTDMTDAAPLHEPETGEVIERAEEHETAQEPPRAAEDGPVHRPLIRATLPRHEGQPVERRAPDFTVRQSGGRNGGFREFDSRGRRPGGNGKPFHAGSSGRPGGRPGRPQPQGSRFERSPGQGRFNRQGPPRHKKRSR
jgi:hypothetical protein